MEGLSWKRILEGKFGTLFYVLLGLALALAIHKALGFALNTPTPIVTVSSGSMEPTFWTGDLVVVWGSGNYSPGDITVFEGWKPTPIIHRIVGKYDGKWFKDKRFSKEEFSRIRKVWEKRENFIHKQKEPVFITEGDANPNPDQYCRFLKKEGCRAGNGRIRYPVLKSKIYGEAVFRVPLLGWVKLLAAWLLGFLISNPLLLIGLLVLLAVIYILKEL